MHMLIKSISNSSRGRTRRRQTHTATHVRCIPTFYLVPVSGAKTCHDGTKSSRWDEGIEVGTKLQCQPERRNWDPRIQAACLTTLFGVWGGGWTYYLSEQRARANSHYWSKGRLPLAVAPRSTSHMRVVTWNWQAAWWQRHNAECYFSYIPISHDSWVIIMPHASTENQSCMCWAGRMPVQRTALTRTAHAARAMTDKSSQGSLWSDAHGEPYGQSPPARSDDL